MTEGKEALWEKLRIRSCKGHKDDEGMTHVLRELPMQNVKFFGKKKQKKTRRNVSKMSRRRPEVTWCGQEQGFYRQTPPSQPRLRRLLSE